MEGGWFPAPTRPQAELSFETTALLDDFQALGDVQQISQGELPVSDEPTLRLLLRRSSPRHSPASSNRPSSIHTSLAGSRADRGRRDMYLGRTGFGGGVLQTGHHRGNLVISDSSGYFPVVEETVQGNIRIMSRLGVERLVNNVIAGNLSCRNNSSRWRRQARRGGTGHRGMRRAVTALGSARLRAS